METLELQARLAANARRLRVAAGLTLQEAGERAGIAWRTWQGIERAEHGCTLATLAGMARALGCAPADLLA